MPKLTKTDEYYLQIADAVSIKSKCLKKHYGAIIVKNNEIISTGFNGPARGEDHCVKCTKVGSDKDMIEYSSCPAIHAEMNCIGKVVWDDETISFQVTNRLSAESYEVLDECSVIGNIFDNPELINE